MKPLNPCDPSPCGPNSACKIIAESPSCSCLPNFRGVPPNCQPECLTNNECPFSLACINKNCKDPCPGLCGVNAECRVVSHTPSCICLSGFTGDPLIQCNTVPTPITFMKTTPCDPSPCGDNAICREKDNAGSCSCLTDYIGNPYEGCRPECILNSDCPSNKACMRNKCSDPCPGTCGQNSICQVINHLPVCNCISGFTGNPFIFCSLIPPESKDIHKVASILLIPIVLAEIIPKHPCRPTPCGANSQCREVNSQSVCSCLPGYSGSPPACRPECTVNSECAHNKACINQKCSDPCPGTCGINSICKVINHSPLCSCLPGHTGDPFTNCYRITSMPTILLI